MNKNIYRFAGAFVVLLGLAYLGNRVFMHPAEDSAAVTPGAASTPAAAPQANAYVVYPDKDTETALGFPYSSFKGDFVHGVVMTPLPPYMPGRVTLRIQPQKGQALTLALADTRCASPVHVFVSRFNDKNSMVTAVLSTAAPKLSVPFGDGNIPALLVEVQMDEKAPNNYFCGIAVGWSQ